MKKKKRMKRKLKGMSVYQTLTKWHEEETPDQLLHLLNSPSNLHISLYFNYHIHQETLKLNYSMNPCYILRKK